MEEEKLVNLIRSEVSLAIRQGDFSVRDINIGYPALNVKGLSVISKYDFREVTIVGLIKDELKCDDVMRSMIAEKVKKYKESAKERKIAELQEQINELKK